MISSLLIKPELHSEIGSYNKKPHIKMLKMALLDLVSLAAVFSIVTQRSSHCPLSLSSWGGALRDDTKNGCEGDYTRLCDQ